MFPAMWSQPPCMNMEVSAVSGQPLSICEQLPVHLAGVEGEVLDRPVEVGQLVEEPDRDVDRDQRHRDDRERPRRHVVADREHGVC